MMGMETGFVTDRRRTEMWSRLWDPLHLDYGRTGCVRRLQVEGARCGSVLGRLQNDSTTTRTNYFMLHQSFGLNIPLHTSSYHTHTEMVLTRADDRSHVLTLGESLSEEVVDLFPISSQHRSDMAYGYQIEIIAMSSSSATEKGRVSQW